LIWWQNTCSNQTAKHYPIPCFPSKNDKNEAVAGHAVLKAHKDVNGLKIPSLTSFLVQPSFSIPISLDNKYSTFVELFGNNEKVIIIIIAQSHSTLLMEVK